MSCRVEWVDLAHVEHGCVRGNPEHLSYHRCGCGATLPVAALGPRPVAVGTVTVCSGESTVERTATEITGRTA